MAPANVVCSAGRGPWGGRVAHGCGGTLQPVGLPVHPGRDQRPPGPLSQEPLGNRSRDAASGPGRRQVTDHIPVTSPARTLVDLAGCISERALEDAVDDALTRGITTLARLQRCAARLETGRRGAKQLASVLGRWADGDAPEGVAEMRLVRRLVANGLPAPALQYEVRDGAGKVVARVDMAFPDERVAIELEGFRWHGTPRGQARDKARLRRLSALGWLVLPATPADLAADGALVARQVEAARTHWPATRTAG